MSGNDKKIARPNYLLSVNELNTEIKSKANNLAQDSIEKMKSMFYQVPVYDCFFKPKKISIEQEKEFIVEIR